MTTTTSSSKNTRFLSVYRAAVKGQLAFAIVAAILYALLIPLIYFVSMHYQSHTIQGLTDHVEIAAYYASQNMLCSGIYLAEAQSGFVMASIIFLSFVLALVQNAYLHSKKNTDFYHSLPVRRTCLLGANFLATMTTVLVPFFAVYLLTMLMQLIQYGRYMPSFTQYFAFIGVDLLCCVLAAAVIYLFVTFIAVNVGTVFDAFAISGVVGILPLSIYLIGYAVWESMVYGSSLSIDYALLLSPFTFAFQRFVNHPYPTQGIQTTGYALTTLHMGVWLVIGAVLFFAAAACYKRRKSEIAEQTQPSGVLQIVVKCFGAFCGGALFFAIFAGGGIVAWILSILAGSVLIGIIAELILSRGFRSLRKNIKWLLLAGVLCIVMVIGAHVDLTGYAARVPAPESVQSVDISYRGRLSQLSPDTQSWWYGSYSYSPPETHPTTLTDPESIAILTQAHRQAVENQPPKNYEDYEQMTADYPYIWMELTYRLKNGQTMQRSYYRMAEEATLTLTNLENKRDFITSGHALFRLGEPDGGRVRGVQMYNALGRQTAAPSLSAVDNDRLIDAIRQDLLAEPLEEILDPSAPALGYLMLSYDYGKNDAEANFYGESGGTSICYILVGESYTNTIAVLGELNLLQNFESAAEVDGIALEPMSNTGVSYVLLPDGSYDYSYTDSSALENYQITSQNAAEITAVRAAGRNQMLGRHVDQTDTAYTDVVVVNYFSSGVNVGRQLVRLSALPEDLRERSESTFFTDLLFEEIVTAEVVAYRANLSGIAVEELEVSESVTMY